MNISEKLIQAKADLDAVHEAGKKEEYDTFWTKFFAEVRQTKNGSYLFAGKGWNGNTFNPPYGEGEINFINNAQGLFYYSGYISKEKLKVFDWSKMTTTPQFAYSLITELPEIDSTGASTVGSVFSVSNIESVDKFILKDDGSQAFASNTFNTTKLKHIIIEGVIGKTVSVSSCPLDKESIKSFVNALSLDVTGQTITFNLNAVNKAFETSEGANNGSTSDEWAALKETKQNWKVEVVE